jgi:hypothetical protein
MPRHARHGSLAGERAGHGTPNGKREGHRPPGGARVGTGRDGMHTGESPSLVLVINDTKLLMPCVKCFELGISNTCDEGVCGKKCGHKIIKKWCMDMMIKWRRRI